MATEIRRFRSEDLEFALAQTLREGWDNTTAIFRLILEHDPRGSFVAEVDGQRAGMVTTTSFPHSSWLGNLIVVPEGRRTGLGERLMRHAISHLEEHGVETMRLEADPMGIGIYRRLGFVDHSESPRLEKLPPHPRPTDRSEPLEDGDLREMRELDARFFGDDRRRMLEGLLEIALTARCLRVRGRIEAFAMALPSREGIRLGPCVSRDPGLVEPLIDSILARFDDRKVIVALSAGNGAALARLESRGFRRTPSCLHMLLGKAPAGNLAGVPVALANGAIG
jgi:ribosomal protein S18 acetylase RimI-like enzyme